MFSIFSVLFSLFSAIFVSFWLMFEAILLELILITCSVFVTTLPVLVLLISHSIFFWYIHNYRFPHGWDGTSVCSRAKRQYHHWKENCWWVFCWCRGVLWMKLQWVSVILLVRIVDCWFDLVVDTCKHLENLSLMVIFWQFQLIFFHLRSHPFPQFARVAAQLHAPASGDNRLEQVDQQRCVMCLLYAICGLMFLTLIYNVWVVVCL